MTPLCKVLLISCKKKYVHNIYCVSIVTLRYSSAVQNECHIRDQHVTVLRKFIDIQSKKSVKLDRTHCWSYCPFSAELKKSPSFVDPSFHFNETHNSGQISIHRPIDFLSKNKQWLEKNMNDASFCTFR